jgi:hypothetical protein
MRDENLNDDFSRYSALMSQAASFGAACQRTSDMQQWQGVPQRMNTANLQEQSLQ